MQAVEIDGYRIEDASAPGQGVQLLRARQLVNDSPVLLQIWEGPAQPARLAIRQLAGLRHPGLATVLDVGETPEGRAYAALTAPAVPSLRLRLAQGLDLVDSLSLLRRLALIARFVESRCPLLPVLDAAEIFADAQGRPLLTRLWPPASSPEHHRPLQQLLALGFEALTGRPPADLSDTLPDYLARWQPLFGLDGRTAEVAELLALLDELEGKSTSNHSRTGAAAGSAASPPSAAPAAAAHAASTALPVRSETPATVQATTAPPPGRPSPAAAAAAPGKRDSAATAADRVVVSPPAPEPAPAADARRTGPSKRLEPEPKRAQLARSPGQTSAPSPPSRMPLLLAAGLALPLLGGLLWWGLASDTPSAAPEARAQGGLEQARPVASGAPSEPSTVSAVSQADIGFQAPDPEADWTPTSPIELDPTTLPTVEDPLERLLLLARTNLQAGRLVAPPGRNALDRYLQALRIEADHRATLQGIAELASLCLRQAMDAQEFEAKLSALACVDRVVAAHPVAGSVQQEAQRYRQGEHDRYVQTAGEALAAWRGREATQGFDQARRLLPDSTAAREGLARAEALGRAGYRFRDGLQNGAEGPEMLVVNGLAWAVSETRVSEFETYWTAAGGARFGADLPACRDRESLLRSSRRRDWRDPDFTQGADHPVACVSFAMAQHYAEWLSASSGQRYRLPSLAEWRAVAGAAPSGCKANLRDQTAARVWNARDPAACSDGFAHTAPVGSSGEQGALLGIWGNVAEWLADCEGASCRQRLAAGGSWFSAAGEVSPRGFAAEPAFTTIGIRVVREIPPRE